MILQALHLHPLRPLHHVLCIQLRPAPTTASICIICAPCALSTLQPPTLHPPLLQFARPGAPYDNEGDPYEGGARGVNDYVKSLEFPVDSPWRKNRG